MPKEEPRVSRLPNRRMLLKQAIAASGLALGTGTSVATTGGKRTACRKAIENASERAEKELCVIDDFEDNDLEEYSGDLWAFSTQSETTHDGEYALKGVNESGIGGGDNFITSHSGLPLYPAQGDTFEFWTMYPELHYWGHSIFLFGVQDLENYYRVGFDKRDQRVILSTVNNGFISTSSGEVEFKPGVWYRTVVQWDTDGTITAAVYDEDGTEVGDVQRTDNRYEEGGIGWNSRNIGRNDTNYWDMCRLT